RSKLRASIARPGGGGESHLSGNQRRNAPMTMLFNRRRFLRASGVALALPLLESLEPALARGSAPEPRRMVAICTNLGLLEKNFFPASSGKDYAATPYLETLEAFRGSFTV